MPRWMRAYAALAEEKYKLQTYPVLINILKISNREIPTSFTSNFAGLRAIQDYRVINLWEQEGDDTHDQQASVACEELVVQLINPANPTGFPLAIAQNLPSVDID